MFKGLLSSLASLVILFVVPFLSTSCAMGNPPVPSSGAVADSAAGKTVEGEISLIEVDGTILVRSTSGEAVVIEPQRDTRISRDGKPAKAAELKPGDGVEVRYVPDTHRALEIRATGKP